MAFDRNLARCCMTDVWLVVSQRVFVEQLDMFSHSTLSNFAWLSAQGVEQVRKI